MQTRRRSLLEAVANTGIAFALSLLFHKFVVLPLTAAALAEGMELTDWRIAISTCLAFTCLSLARTYAVRRYFNRRD